MLDFNIELDSVDRQIILLITQGSTSAYSVWAAMQKESKAKHESTKVLAYKNIYQRTINLSKAGYLEEIKLNDKINIHGRRDYKVTIKGLKQLLFYFISHPKALESINEYMDKSKLNKQYFTNWLVDMSGAIIYLVNVHNRFIEDEIGFEWKNGEYITVYHRAASKLKRERDQAK